MALRWRRERRRRAAREALARDRCDLLHEQGVDRRLVEAVWGPRDGVVGELLAGTALTEVGWLDEVALDQEGVVPLLSLRPEQEGIVAVRGWLLHLEGEAPPVQRDLASVWQLLFEAPVARWLRAERTGAAAEIPAGLRSGAHLDDALLGLELERLRGTPLRAWFEREVRRARGLDG